LVEFRRESSNLPNCQQLSNTIFWVEEGAVNDRGGVPGKNKIEAKPLLHLLTKNSSVGSASIVGDASLNTNDG